MQGRVEAVNIKNDIFYLQGLSRLYKANMSRPQWIRKVFTDWQDMYNCLSLALYMNKWYSYIIIWQLNAAITSEEKYLHDEM